MSYYILQKGFELCGWKGLPFALRYPNPHFTDFFDEEAYRVVYALDGQHDIDEDALTGNQKKLLDWLREIRIALPSDGTQRLEPWQEYKSLLWPATLTRRKILNTSREPKATTVKSSAIWKPCVSITATM